MNNYFKLLSFLKNHRKLFSTAVFTMFVASLFEGFQLSLLVPMTDRIFNNKKIATPGNLPEFISAFIDKLNTIEPETMFWIFPVVVICAMVIKHIFIFAHQYLMGDVSQRVIRDVRSSLYEKIQNLSLDYFSQKRTGELISRITNDVHMIENAVSYGLTDLCKSVFLIFIYVVIAFVIYPKAAIILFVVFPFIGIPINQIGKKLRKLSKSYQEKMADINSLLFETISGVRVVKAFCNEDYETKRFRSENHGFYKIRMKSIKRTIIIAPLTEIFGAICGVAIIFLIGRSVMEGALSFGVFILFFGSIMSIISPIKKLGNVNALIQQALAANQRIYDVLDQEPSVKEKTGAIELKELNDSIMMKNIDFDYGNDSEIVLNGINLEIKKGEIVAIVGPTGTGKTTLVNLMPRFYDPIKGSVEMDGVDVKDVSFKSLRKQFGIVTQESILFNDTVKANIAYGYHDASQEEIEAAAQKAFAHRFIEKMPEGYDTMVGDRGFRLSGGEKQRICIARAILANPSILILDEATSQLDSESEKFVQEALDKLMQGRTVVAIAHRLATVIKANKIVVLNEGRIEGIGKHEELLKSCSLYKKLHEMQFKV